MERLYAMQLNPRNLLEAHFGDKSVFDIVMLQTWEGVRVAVWLAWMNGRILYSYL